jgi:hypothetical protein
MLAVSVEVSNSTSRTQTPLANLAERLAQISYPRTRKVKITHGGLREPGPSISLPCVAVAPAALPPDSNSNLEPSCQDPISSSTSLNRPTYLAQNSLHWIFNAIPASVLRIYESSPGNLREFCPRCGATVFFSRRG